MSSNPRGTSSRYKREKELLPSHFSVTACTSVRSTNTTTPSHRHSSYAQATASSRAKKTTPVSSRPSSTLVSTSYQKGPVAAPRSTSSITSGSSVRPRTPVSGRSSSAASGDVTAARRPTPVPSPRTNKTFKASADTVDTSYKRPASPASTRTKGSSDTSYGYSSLPSTAVSIEVTPAIRERSGTPDRTRPSTSAGMGQCVSKNQYEGKQPPQRQTRTRKASSTDRNSTRPLLEDTRRPNGKSSPSSGYATGNPEHKAAVKPVPSLDTGIDRLENTSRTRRYPNTSATPGHIQTRSDSPAQRNFQSRRDDHRPPGGDRYDHQPLSLPTGGGGHYDPYDNFNKQDASRSYRDEFPTSAHMQQTTPTASSAHGRQPTSSAYDKQLTSSAFGRQPTSSAYDKQPTSSASGRQPTSSAYDRQPTSPSDFNSLATSTSTYDSQATSSNGIADFDRQATSTSIYDKQTKSTYVQQGSSISPPGDKLDIPTGHMQTPSSKDVRPKEKRPKERKLKLAKDQIMVSRYIWDYLMKFHKEDIKKVTDHCKISLNQQGNDDHNIKVEFEAPSKRDLEVMDDVFIPLYQKLSSVLTIVECDTMAVQDVEGLIRQLEAIYQCIASRKKTGKLEVTCKTSDQNDVDRILKKSIKVQQSPKQASLAYQAWTSSTPSTISLFQASGYRVRNGVNILIHESDITSLSVEAIVNPANPELRMTAGLSRVIRKTGGNSIEDECLSIYGQRGPLRITDVVLTKAGILAAKHVLHVCGPVWPMNPAEQRRCVEQLQMSVTKILDMASQHRLESIAMPPISSGGLGVPLDVVTDAMWKCVGALKSRTSLKEIHLVDISPDFLILLRDQFAKDRSAQKLDNITVTELIAKRKPRPQQQVQKYGGSSAAPDQKLSPPSNQQRPLPDDSNFQIPPVAAPRQRDDERTNRYSKQIQDLSLNPDAGFKVHGFKVNNKIEVVIHKCDITKLHVDGIVSAANALLQPSGGLAKIIGRAAGQQFVAECSKYVEKKGRLNLTDVAVTSGGLLPCKKVFHAAGPHWPKQPDPEKENRCLEDLQTTFCRIFDQAQKSGMTSLACPAISSGVYRVPVDSVARSACEAVLNVVHPAGRLKEIHLVDISDVTLGAMRQAFEDGLLTNHISALDAKRAELIVECRVAGYKVTKAEEPRMETRDSKGFAKMMPVAKNLGDQFPAIGFSFSGRRIFVHMCDMTRLRVDCIVSAANTKLNNFGGLARTIAHVAGDQMDAECKDIIRRYGELKVADVLKTTGGNLPAKYVLHAVGPRWPKSDDAAEKKQCLAELRETFSRIFGQAHRYHVTSLAVPAISSGIFGVPEKEVVSAMVEMVRQEVPKCKQLRDIHFVDISSNILEMICAGLKSAGLQELNRQDVLYSLDAVIVTSGRRSPPDRTPDQKTRGASRGAVVNDEDHNTETTDVRQLGEVLLEADGGGRVTQRNRGAVVDSDEDNMETTPPRQTQLSADNTGRPKQRNRGALVASDEEDTGSDTPTAPKRRAKKTKEDCVICLNEITNPKTLKCKHTFCQSCIDHMFKNYQPKCPSCGVLYGVEKGNQPAGTMKHWTERSALEGHRGYSTIVISYDFPSGYQTVGHPNPGQRYSGTSRTAYLPDSPEGREILKLLKRAFDAKLTFTIGRSVTTGADNVVTWNDIHHKTSTYGGATGFGYPDPTYLNRVRAELAAKGIM